MRRYRANQCLRDSISPLARRLCARFHFQARARCRARASEAVSFKIIERVCAVCFFSRRGRGPRDVCNIYVETGRIGRRYIAWSCRLYVRRGEYWYVPNGSVDIFFFFRGRRYTKSVAVTVFVTVHRYGERMRAWRFGFERSCARGDVFYVR